MAEPALAALRRKLSPQGNVVSEAGRQRTIDLFGEPLSPQRVVERICGDVRRDGLSAVVPYAEKAYRNLRKATAIAPPGRPGGCIKLNGRFGLHPALADLHADYQAGRLAVVHAVGSHDTTRSHFDAQDYMSPARRGGRGRRTAG